VQQIYLHMNDPREPHLAAMKRILRYLQGMPDYGLLIIRAAPTSSSTRTLTGPVVQTHRSTSGYAVFLGDNLVSWSAKRQTNISRSSVEAEYHAIANGMAEATWLR
jgi:hypothetical protein